jgi:uncharacterized protein (UPF0333 family)
MKNNHTTITINDWRNSSRSVQVDLEFSLLNILIIVFPCGFKDFYGIYQLKK